MVDAALKRLNEGFLYQNNLGLCGAGFMNLTACNVSDLLNRSRPEPFGPGSTALPTREIPETANLRLPCNQTHCSNSSRSHHASVVVGAVITTIALSAIGILTFTYYRHRKQKLGSSFEISDNRLSTDQGKGVYRKSGSPLISLEYNGWDPLADGRNFSRHEQDVFQSFRFNLDEVETATQYFSDVNFLSKSDFSTTYKGILRDGSVVAIKSISKSICKSEEAEFVKGLNILTLLRHKNLVRLRGFCCSRGRGECFLVYDFVPNGNLLQYLDVKDGDAHVLEWSTRVSIVKGIAKGLFYLLVIFL